MSVANGVDSSDWMASSARREVTNDFPSQNFIYFLVARNWLGRTGLRVVVDVVLPPMPEKNAAHPFDPLDEVTALHPTSISSILLIPGISPDENSW